MTDGIDKSRVFIAFITHEYMSKVQGEREKGENDNVKFEFDYACLKKGVECMIPVVMEAKLKDQREWLGVVAGKLGTKLFVDCSEEFTEEGATRLADEIISHLSRARKEEVLNHLQVEESKSRFQLDEQERVSAAAARHSTNTRATQMQDLGNMSIAKVRMEQLSRKQQSQKSMQLKTTSLNEYPKVGSSFFPKHLLGQTSTSGQ
jgi:hypothetical protein